MLNSNSLPLFALIFALQAFHYCKEYKVSIAGGGAGRLAWNFYPGALAPGPRLPGKLQDRGRVGCGRPAAGLSSSAVVSRGRAGQRGNPW